MNINYIYYDGYADEIVGKGLKENKKSGASQTRSPKRRSEFKDRKNCRTPKYNLLFLKLKQMRKFFGGGGGYGACEASLSPAVIFPA